jgi:RNA polymerase sigma factor (sigma-70 family)
VAIRPNGLVFQQIRTLYDVGVAGDQTDAELLKRFATLNRDAAEPAFAALVERHRPMVLRVCQSLLKNSLDAEDACQATFFILARKARFVWVRDSLAPWLHRVARRVAARANASTRRRREHERRAAELRLKVVHADNHAEVLIGLLHAEIDRLPEKYRVAVIVCDMEGLSHEKAARQLGWPVGTVKSRLARARQLLRGRLTARGLAAPTFFVLTQATTSSVDAAVSSLMVNSTLGSALFGAKPPTTGAVSVGVAKLAEEVLETMILTKWKITWAGVLIACALTGGTAAVLGRQYDGSKPSAAAGRADARSADFASPAGERASTTAPDFIKHSRGMIITRLEEELALARARLDRTLRRVASPDDPAAHQARRTVDEIEGLLARVDGVLIDVVDRYPTMFDFSGGRDDQGLATGSSKSGTLIMPLNVNDVYQSSARKSGAWQKNNPSDQAQSQSANLSGGPKNDGAKGQGNQPSSNAKSGNGYEQNSSQQPRGQNADPYGNKSGSGTQGQGDSRSSLDQPGETQSSNSRQRKDQSAHPQNPINADRQHNSRGQGEASVQGQQQYRSNRHTSTDSVDVEVIVSERQQVIEVGGQTTFIVRLRNYGTKDVTHLRVMANLSRNLEFAFGTRSHGAGVRFDSQENVVTFQPIDKLGPGKEAILGVTAKVRGSGPKLATCCVSVTHDNMPEENKLKDMATVQVTNSGRQ